MEKGVAGTFQFGLLLLAKRLWVMRVGIGVGEGWEMLGVGEVRRLKNL